MAVYAIADLHLSFSTNKPMDVFGEVWVNHAEKIRENWLSTIKENDYVVVVGDVSWAMRLEEAEPDFRFIDSLPGRKIILRGNHDYWWASTNKFNNFLKDNGFETISFLHNNSYCIDDIIICGTRGWVCPGDESFSAKDRKIYQRETSRLELSLETAQAFKAGRSVQTIVIAAIHYPPFNSNTEISGFVEIMNKYGVKRCVYGHIHGVNFDNVFQGNIMGMNFMLVSADYLKFKPKRIDMLGS